MNNSRLCYKIQICKQLEAMDAIQFLHAFQLFANEFGFKNTKSIFIKLIVNHTDELFTNHSLQRLLYQFEDIVNKNNRNSIHNNTIYGANGNDNIDLNASSTTNGMQQFAKQQTFANIYPRGNVLPIFPLLELPYDIVPLVLYFVSQKDIFSIERCNRILYQIINNKSFISKHNGFKHLTLTNNNLKLISPISNTNKNGCDLFKFSLCKQMEFHFMVNQASNSGVSNLNNRRARYLSGMSTNYFYGRYGYNSETDSSLSSEDNNSNRNSCNVNNRQSTILNNLEKLVFNCECNDWYSNWFIDALQSIQELRIIRTGIGYNGFTTDSTFPYIHFINALPIAIFCDQEKSNLQHIYFDEGMIRPDSTRDETAEEIENTFHAKCIAYMQSPVQLFSEYGNDNDAISTGNTINGKNVKTLKCVTLKHSNTSMINRLFDMQHLWLNSSQIHIDFFVYCPKYHRSLTTLTIQSCIDIVGNPNYDNIDNKNDSQFSGENNYIYDHGMDEDTYCDLIQYGKCSIDTIRLINIKLCRIYTIRPIICNKQYIKSINLENTLKNLTIHLELQQLEFKPPVTYHIEYDSNEDEVHGYNAHLKPVLLSLFKRDNFQMLQTVSILFEYRGGLLIKRDHHEINRVANAIQFVNWLFDQFFAATNVAAVLNRALFEKVNFGIKMSGKSPVANIFSWKSNQANNQWLNQCKHEWESLCLMKSTQLATHARTSKNQRSLQYFNALIA